MPLTADDFRDELQRILDEATRQGHRYVDVNAGEIHRGLEGFQAQTTGFLSAASDEGEDGA